MKDKNLFRKIELKILRNCKYVYRCWLDFRLPRSFADLVRLRGYFPCALASLLFCLSFLPSEPLSEWRTWFFVSIGPLFLFSRWFENLIGVPVNFVERIGARFIKQPDKKILLEKNDNHMKGSSTKAPAIKKKKKKKKRKGPKFSIGEIVEVRDLTGEFANLWRKAKIVKIQPFECQILGYSASYTYDEYRKIVEEKSDESSENFEKVDDKLSLETESSSPKTKSESDIAWMKKKPKPRKRKKRNDIPDIFYKRQGPPNIRKQPANEQRKIQSVQTGPRIITKARTDMAWQDGTHMNILRRNAPPSPPASHRLPPPIREMPPPPSGRPASGYGFLGGSPVSSDSESENDMKLGDLLPVVPSISVSPERSSRRFDAQEQPKEFNGFERHDFVPKRRSFSPDRPRLPDFMADGLAYHEREVYEKAKLSPRYDQRSPKYKEQPSRRRESPYERPPHAHFNEFSYESREMMYGHHQTDEVPSRESYADEHDSSPSCEFDDQQRHHFSGCRTRGRGASSRTRARKRHRGGFSSGGRGRAHQSRSISPPKPARTRGRGRSRGRGKKKEAIEVRRTRGRGKKRTIVSS